MPIPGGTKCNTQLERPLAFMKEALKSWGQAHIDNSEQSIQFHIQLQEWKNTKIELHNIFEKAYQDTQLLKEHVVSNKVTQDHLYTLHNQVKHTAQWVCDALLDIDCLCYDLSGHGRTQTQQSP